jgi:N-acetylmuramoyl-L-alanine amidase
MGKLRMAAVLLMAVAWIAWSTSAPAFGRLPPADGFDTVIIDAGHGGDDKGARGPRGRLEKDVVLDVARRLALDLRARGLRVVMTRKGDTFVPLEERTNIANDARGDLFVSIHANAARDGDVRGSETFFLSLNASDDSARQVAMRENEAFRGSAGVMTGDGDPLLAIMRDLIDNQHMQESSEFAQIAQSRLAEIEPARSRGVKQAPFVVLMGVQMPASLVEIGFMTHPSEEKMLASAPGQTRIVAALVNAVLEFGRRFDVRRGIAPATIGEKR